MLKMPTDVPGVSERKQNAIVRQQGGLIWAVSIYWVRPKDIEKKCIKVSARIFKKLNGYISFFNSFHTLRTPRAVCLHRSSTVIATGLHAERQNWCLYLTVLTAPHMYSRVRPISGSNTDWQQCQKDKCAQRDGDRRYHICFCIFSTILLLSAKVIRFFFFLLPAAIGSQRRFSALYRYLQKLHKLCCFLSIFVRRVPKQR